ncbi:MAG TPA: sensor histidine kinase [Anaerolineaceae bacterium]|nr:sensor histidine kinase [Anaerolineaceae bacterium]
MNHDQTKNRLLLSYLAAFILIGSVAFRAIFTFFSTPFLWWIVGLLAAYIVLFATEWQITRRWRSYLPVYFVLQSFLIFVLQTAIDPYFDYFAVLFIPLTVQAFWYLPQKIAYRWTALFALVTSAGSIESAGWGLGLGFAFTYTSVLCFVVIVCVMTLRAEKAQAESQALLGELRVAHRKLQEYSQQVEELAAAQERNRLARELHDSVTQTIFSLTLTAQAARILLDRDPGRVAGQLDHLQALAQSALAEMRSLIQQLRPHTIAEEGLAAALRRHAAERQKKDGLQVDLSIRGETRLPAEVEEGLYRVIQEALNNVVKHAQTGRAAVTVCLDENPATVLVEDSGKGFDPAQARRLDAQHFGLSSMAERVEVLGGKLIVDSKPGAGTRIRVEVNRIEEGEHA